MQSLPARQVTSPAVPAHRAFVGGTTPGLWWGIGRLQFHFLVSQGLRPHHVFLDCACGGLRAGLWLVPYLHRGNYLGIDIDGSLIEAGLQTELSDALIAVKRPQFAVNGDFDFSSFDQRAQFGIAQSLFTHLVPTDIAHCLGNLADWAAPDIRFFVTFFEGPSDDNPTVSDPQKGFAYSRDELRALGADAGLDVAFIDDFRHPKNQKMAAFTKTKAR